MRFTVEEISKKLSLRYLGDGSRLITSVSTPQNSSPESAFFIEDVQRVDISKLNGGCVFIKEKDSSLFDINKFSVIICENPKLDFARFLYFVEKYNQKDYKPHISELSYISNSSYISKSCYIGNFVTIEEGAKILDDVIIEDGCYIGKNSIIEKNTRLYPRVVIRENVKIGKNCIIHSGSVIGSDGFGYINIGEKHIKIPQVGGVIIEDDVEIGSNVSIDRATLENTIIGQGTKIDNLVHIAHNVKIGKNCLILAGAAIAGSTIVEDNCIIGGQAGIADHLRIGKGAIVMSKSGVIGNIKSGEVVFGYPARRRSEFMRIEAAMSKLPDIYKEYMKKR